MALFRLGEFILHSGSKSFWKIDCETLTDEDWATLARIIYESVPRFRRVIGIPKGGMKLAEALEPYCSFEKGHPLLIVDDVLTTGKSMEKMKKDIGEDCIGAVVFARGKCPDWIESVVTVNNRLWNK